MTATSTGSYLRATVISAQRVLDVALPTDQVVADFMPDLLHLIGDSHASATEMGASVLHTSAGGVVDPERPLASAQLRDGVVLRLVAEREAPAEPMVSDLLDLLESESPRLVWTAQATQWALACTGVAALGVAAGLWVMAAPMVLWPRLTLVAIAAYALSGVSASLGSRAVAWVSGAAAVAAAGLGVSLGSSTPAGAGVWGGVVVLCAIAAMGWCAQQWRSAAISALTWMGVLAVAGLSSVLGADLVVVGAIVAVAASLTLGMLPRAVLGLTGLLRTDTHVTSGRTVSRRDARVVVDQAHRALAGAVAACAMAYGVAGFGVAVTADLSPWALGLTGATLMSWLARMRHFPLISQRVVIVMAVGVVSAGIALGVVAAETDLRWWVVGACATVGTGVLAAGSLTISSLAAAVTRRWAQRLETVAVIATLPCLLGLLGVYADLLETF